MSSEQSISVELADHPLFDEEVLVPDHALLDGYAADYASSLDAPPEMERFLFGQVPVSVFDEIFAGDVSADDAAGHLWAMHLSGYFGGRWLRGEIAGAQPDAPLVGFSQEPTAEWLAGRQRFMPRSSFSASTWSSWPSAPAPPRWAGCCGAPSPSCSRWAEW